jgi:site-specific recombinase XerD
MSNKRRITCRGKEKRQQALRLPSTWFVSISERGRRGFNRMVKRAGAAVGLGIKAHAHMLRHAFGFKLAEAGVDTRALRAYLGHRNIQHAVRYTELAPDRFKDFWRD